MISGWGWIEENRSIDPEGNVSKVRTDGAGRTLQLVDALGHIVNMEYG